MHLFVKSIRCPLALCMSLLFLSNLPGAENWPTRGYDPGRCGATPEPLCSDLYILWQRDMSLDLEDLPPDTDQDPDTATLDEEMPIRQLAFALAGPSTPEGDSWEQMMPTIVQDKTIIFVSTKDGLVTALDADTGSPKWEFPCGAPVRFAPALNNSGSVIVAGEDGMVHCISIEEGVSIWQFDTADAVRRAKGPAHDASALPMCGGPVITGGQLFFAAGGWPFAGIYFFVLDLLDMNPGGPSHRLVELTNSKHKGYLAASENKIFIPQGPSPPLVFDRLERKFESLHYEAFDVDGVKIAVKDDWLIQGDHLIYRPTDRVMHINSRHSVITDTHLYFSKNNRLLATRLVQHSDATSPDQEDSQQAHIEFLWQVFRKQISSLFTEAELAQWQAGPVKVEMKAAGRLFGITGNALFAVDIPEEEKAPTVSWGKVLDDGEIPISLIAADDKLIVTTAGDRIIVFSCIGAVFPEGQATDREAPLEDRPVGWDEITEVGPNLTELAEDNSGNKLSLLQLPPDALAETLHPTTSAFEDQSNASPEYPNLTFPNEGTNDWPLYDPTLVDPYPTTPSNPGGGGSGGGGSGGGGSGGGGIGYIPGSGGGGGGGSGGVGSGGVGSGGGSGGGGSEGGGTGGGGGGAPPPPPTSPALPPVVPEPLTLLLLAVGILCLLSMRQRRNLRLSD